MDLIDTHAHLDYLKGDIDNILKRAHFAGVFQIITVGVGLTSSLRAAEIANQNKNIFFTVGVHPNDAVEIDKETWSNIEKLAQSGAKAIGECGLDYYRNFSFRAIQQKIFVRQIELARLLNLPLVIHDRDAHNDVFYLLKEQKAQEIGGVFHCFNADYNIAKKILDMGFMIGITGNITYPKNDTLRNLLKKVPKDCLVIETDCPYLTPIPYKKFKNEPSYLPITNFSLAKILGISPEEMANYTTANAQRLYNLPKKSDSDYL